VTRASRLRASRRSPAGVASGVHASYETKKSRARGRNANSPVIHKKVSLSTMTHMRSSLFTARLGLGDSVASRGNRGDARRGSGAMRCAIVPVRGANDGGVSTYRVARAFFDASSCRVGSVGVLRVGGASLEFLA